MKKALITGVTGQDGSYLAEFLINKGYKVYGLKRRSSLFNTKRVDYLYQDPHNVGANLIFHYGDLTDASNLIRIIQEVQPDEIYNLAAQSHVKVGFGMPEYTANVNALGTLRILESIRALKLEKKTKFYQASSSELFGDTKEVYQNENTPFKPCSPYACAKLYAYWCIDGYRKAYNMFACNGILFNHECISENTPIIIRENGIIFIKRVKDIKRPRSKGKTVQQWEFKETEIWDGDDFVRLKLITATKRNKKNLDFQCKIINTRNGIVEVTNHHRMLNERNKKIQAKNVMIKSKLLHGKFPFQKEQCKVSKEEARFLGMMVADGSIAESGKASFTKTNKKLMVEFENLWVKVRLGTISRRKCEGGYGVSIQASLNGGRDYLRYIKYQIYTNDGFKKVPDRILNTSKEIQLSFLEGYNICDGLKAGSSTHIFKSFKTNSILLAQGLIFLIKQTTNQEFNITFSESEKYYGYYSINFLSLVDNSLKEKRVKSLIRKGVSQRGISREAQVSRNFIRKIQNGGHVKKGNHLSKPKKEVKKIISHKNQPKWVFDLETDSGKLMAGVGTIIVSNSPRRGETFVTRKITMAAVRISLGLQEKLYLGNIDSKRDWGHSQDYIKMMWMMLQQDEPDDFVIATGEQHSIREFCESAFGVLGIELEWTGQGVDERGFIKKVRKTKFKIDIADWVVGKEIINIDPCYYRPVDVNNLLGDASKACEKLGWIPTISFDEMVYEMVESDFNEILCGEACHIIPSCEADL